MQLITDISGLDAIESAWRDLATARGNAFITPEWFRSWFRYYGEKATPFVIAVSRPDGSLEGVVPLVRVAEGRRRVLRFAGANLGEYFHPACRESDESGVVAACSQMLQDHRSEWSGAILHNTDASAAWPRQLADGKGLAPLGGPLDSMPYVPLKGVTWEQYLADRSAKFRAQLRRSTRRLEEDHQLEFRTTAATDDPTCLPVVEQQLGESVQNTKQGLMLVIDPALADKLLESIGEEMKRPLMAGFTPVCLSSPNIRLALRRLVEARHPQLAVVSYNEIMPEVELISTGMVSLDDN